jgi:hypothetical protein
MRIRHLVADDDLVAITPALIGTHRGERNGVPQREVSSRSCR